MSLATADDPWDTDGAPERCQVDVTMSQAHQLIQHVDATQTTKKFPPFRPGDTVRVSVRISEGDKERTQDFEGLCIRRKGSGVAENFTVRRLSFGIGMERIFPLHSPRIERIEVLRAGRVRRAKLYFLRELKGKAARIADLRDKPGRGTNMARVAEAMAEIDGGTKAKKKKGERSTKTDAKKKK